MVARIPLLSPDEARRRAAEARVVPQFAELNIFRALLNRPVAAKAVQELLVALLFRGKLDARLRELVIMRIGWVTGSNYEWTQHWRVATELGVPEQDLLAVRDWRASDRLSDADRAVLAATDETLEHGCISPQTWARCAEHLNSTEVLLELPLAIGCWHFISSLLRSLEIPLEEGVASWPPVGVAPRG